MVFVVETKLLPPKRYRIVRGCGLVSRVHENISTNWPKIHCSRKFYPTKNTRYSPLRMTSRYGARDAFRHIGVPLLRARVKVALRFVLYLAAVTPLNERKICYFACQQS